MNIEDFKQGMTFRDFADFIKQGVREVGESFENPDDDWMMVSFFVAPDPNEGEKEMLAVMPIFHDDKDEIAKIQVLFATQQKARLFGMVSSSWMIINDAAEMTDEEFERQMVEGIADHPDRIEAVFVQVMDGERSEFWHAKILRDGEQPPAMGEWDGPELDHVGRFVDNMREALR